MKNIDQLLQQNFGFNSLRPGQKEIIDAIAAGHSAAAIFPTGSGKSLCYQLPALFLPHLTLVISPLLALMKDQIDFLNAQHIPAGSIDSTQTHEQSNEIKQGVKSGRIKILMISVERFKNERFREFIKQVPISLMVIDEAHCISEWGHNFRPDYIKLTDYQQQFNIPQVLLLTATATSHVISDMSREFSISAENIITTGFYRKNLNLSVVPTAEEDKLNYLGHYLNSHQGEASIIYVTLQKTAESISQWLNQNGFHSEAYHAGLNSELREQIQERFMNSQTSCIVATIAFGMGIDKNNIRQIIHYDLPKSIENYAQEIGRSGRDGQTSNCLLLANFHGLNTLKNFVYGDTPDVSGIRALLNELKISMNSASGLWEVLSNPLSSLSNIRLLPLKTLLVYLELRGIIQPKYSYYAEYKFKLLISEEALVQKFQGERQLFVQTILAHSQKAKIWNTLNIDAIQQNYQTDRQRIITALDYFHEKGWIILENKQMTDVYQVLDPQFDTDELAQELYQQFKHKEQSQIKRIEAMLDLFQSQQCLSQQLAFYFGDQSLTQPCGHCSVCQGDYQSWHQPKTLKPIISSELQSAADNLNQRIMDKFSQPASVNLMCSYLCGITSPWLTKVKAKGLGHFGQYERYDYAEVRKALEGVYGNL